MIRTKAKPACTECRRLKKLKVGAAIELRRLYETKAIAIAVQHAADNDADFVVADALAVILARLDDDLLATSRTTGRNRSSTLLLNRASSLASVFFVCSDSHS
jgi:hypothetical protein